MSKYQREREASRFVTWVFFFFKFWLLGVEVVVGSGGCGYGYGRGLSVMSLKSSGHGGFESKYQRKGEASRPG